MALRMRHWIGLVLVGCAALGVRFLPPSEWSRPEREPTLPEVAYEEALRNGAAMANARLVRIRVAEEVIPATLQHDGPLVLGFPEDADGEEVQLSVPEFRAILQQTGLAMIGQTPQVVPADRKLYALRDVTGTVASIPLIASSIMSKATIGMSLPA